MQRVALPAGAEVFESTRDHVFGAWREVFIAVWRTTTTSSAAIRLATALRRFAGNHAAGIAMIVVIEPACQMPDPATRELMARDMKRHETFTRHMVMVFEGEGFGAAVVRSVLAGMQLVSRQSVPSTTVANVAQGAAWLAHRHTPTLSAIDLSAAIDAIRSAETGPS